MPTIPAPQIEDAHKLILDGKVSLFQLHPLGESTIYFKADDPVTWQGDDYESVPCAITGESWSHEGTRATPRMTIGQEDLDLIPFKGLIHDGWLDGAKIVRYEVLTDDLVNDRDIKTTTIWRVKRIEHYSRSMIRLILSVYSSATSQAIPFRQYVTPAFPWVDI